MWASVQAIVSPYESEVSQSRAFLVERLRKSRDQLTEVTRRWCKNRIYMNIF
jgi:hypothetical protein